MKEKPPFLYSENWFLLQQRFLYSAYYLYLHYIYGRIYVWCMVAFTFGNTSSLRYVHSLLSAIADHQPNVNMTIKLT